jgi:DNA polymerase I-like protein with 3'-5' exonuclease and polymerase domains
MRRLATPVILDPRELKEQVAYFSDQEAFSFDVESTGENRNVPSQNVVNWMSMATHGRAIVIPFGHPNGTELLSRATKRLDKATKKFIQIPARYSEPPDQMRPSEVFGLLEPLFFNTEQVKVAHNATFDLISTAKYYGGEAPLPPYADTIVMQWLLDENLNQKGLKDLVRKYYDLTYDHDNVGRCVEAHALDTVAHYALMDARYTWFLYQRFLPLIEAERLTGVFDLEMDLIEALLGMGLEGAPVDVAAIKELEADLSARLVEHEAAIYKAAGQRFNINSNPQKQKILFGPKSEGGQGLKPKKLTPGGAPSTDAEVLEAFPNNALAKGMLEYAEVNKLLGTYVLGYLGVEGDPDRPCRIFDGRIHADFVQYGTVTGRFSCREPNLQNIPRPDTDLGKKIRGLFIAAPGHKLIVADYSQIEMVVLAHFIGSGALFDGLHNGLDPHTATAAVVYGVPPEEVTKAMRQTAKGINFAVVYGAGPDKVAAMANISVKEAKRFLEIHKKSFPEIYRFKDAVIKRAKTRRPASITTMLGRKRRLPAIFAREFKVAGKAERQAVNSLIQGSSADIIKLAMIRLHRTLPEGSRLLLSVHDELVTMAPDDLVEETVACVQEAMLGPGIADLLTVPVLSDVKVVERWAEAK